VTLNQWLVYLDSLARIPWSPFGCLPSTGWTSSGAVPPGALCHWLPVGLGPGRQWQEIGGLGAGGEGSGIPSFLFSSLLGVVSAAEATTRTPASGPSYMALTVTGFW